MRQRILLFVSIHGFNQSLTLQPQTGVLQNKLGLIHVLQGYVEVMHQVNKTMMQQENSFSPVTHCMNREQ